MHELSDALSTNIISDSKAIFFHFSFKIISHSHFVKKMKILFSKEKKPKQSKQLLLCLMN